MEYRNPLLVRPLVRFSKGLRRCDLRHLFSTSIRFRSGTRVWVERHSFFDRRKFRSNPELNCDCRRLVPLSIWGNSLDHSASRGSAPAKMKTNTTPNRTTTTDKPEAKSKVVEVTIQIPKRQAKKLDRAAKLIGISLNRLIEIKLTGA